jgi:hypothetical protein
MDRRSFCKSAILLPSVTIPISALAAPTHAVLYKDPQCGCCEGYATYLKQNGFTVEVKPTMDLTEISRNAGVPTELQGCHTMFVEGYVVDGHVPVNVIRKLIRERPAIAGITLPGMPEGSPGMTGKKREPFVIYEVYKDGKKPTVYTTQ